MIEDKFKELEAKIFAMLEENKSLKVELGLLKESLSQCMTESANTIESLKTESAHKIETIQTESAQALATLQAASSQALETLQAESAQTVQALQDENALIQSRNAELTMHLKKIMSRLESLGVQ
ncbi:hypothetical protein [Wohlfahrtiimonas larvae]|uniref:Uncharacterized protein n=1 Tax=Wohlfahrtiimonas larvae TaxID=1157986 RepID=A0ABP9MVE2_9GAMM|nr:hypothetical protein [Wohlfahrtiimonas larvae]